MQGRKGCQTPTFSQIPDFDKTDGAQASKLAAEFWDTPCPWQWNMIDVMLARDERDKYRFHVVGLAVPRQNGKSWIVRARCFYGLISDGEKILYTCQHGDTADEMFKALSEPFEDEDNEELNSMLKAVRKTNGQQAIYLNNGGYIRFTTRTNSLARGKSCDVLIYDEAQELTSGQQAASLPTISASAKHNTQTIYLGTPPGSEAAGDVFAMMHERVHDGESPRVAWVEWGESDIGDKLDKKRWYRTNPSLGYLIDEVAIQTECDGMADDEFARERLGWWSEETSCAEYVIPKKQWDSCRISPDDSPKEGLTVFAVKFSPDGAVGTISACIKPKNGTPYIEVIENRSMASGMAWFVDFIESHKDNAAQVVVDGGGNAQTLCDLLNLNRHQLIKPTAQQMAGACSMLLNAVNERAVNHMGQGALDDSATKTVKRSIGKGWGFDSTEDADATLIESCALALWSASTTKRDPSRKMRVL